MIWIVPLIIGVFIGLILARILFKTNIKNQEDTIEKICEEIDKIYLYVKELIPKDIAHDLEYRKENFKGLIEKLILAI